MGDGILVYFGYPKSLERNAERAVRSGLGIVEAMAGLNRTLGRDKGIEIAVRIGIATGMVMVGEVVGEGMAQERTVIGEAPNMAARLQGLAGRNGIVIGALTKELSGDAFAYEDLGAHELKGIAGLVQAWGVIGLRDGIAHGRQRARDRRRRGGAGAGRARRGDRAAAPGLAEHQGRRPRPGGDDQRRGRHRQERADRRAEGRGARRGPAADHLALFALSRQQRALSR